MMPASRGDRQFRTWRRRTLLKRTRRPMSAAAAIVILLANAATALALPAPRPDLRPLSEGRRPGVARHQHPARLDAPSDDVLRAAAGHRRRASGELDDRSEVGGRPISARPRGARCRAKPERRFRPTRSASQPQLGVRQIITIITTPYCHLSCWMSFTEILRTPQCLTPAPFVAICPLRI